MKLKRPFILAISSVLTASLLGFASAANGGTISQQKSVGGYRLQLIIGPAESMSTKPGKGERMMSGKAARCEMPMRGMAMGGGACNHHIELHVSQAKTGAVVTNAVVSIALRNTASHKLIVVPISMMQGSAGRRDFHYGNNMYAAPGAYTVSVHVNRVSTLFRVNLT